MKQYKYSYKNYFSYYKYEDGDIVSAYFIKKPHGYHIYDRHGFYKHYCNYIKITQSKGYFNIGKRYSHWVENYHIMYYYL